MRPLSPAGQQALHDVAQRHGFSFDAVATMLDAVINGNGTMAQFNHPEFSGSGQWMAGGMTMVSDMFNNHLKGRVDSLCSDLSALCFQSSGWYAQAPAPSAAGGQALFAPAAPDWWGPDLRWPNSTGSQNGTRYAHFAQACRLAIEVNGRVTVYDTLDHQIGGFSQQQSSTGSMCFNSQYGVVDVGSLPVVSVDGFAPAPAFSPTPAPTQNWAVQNPPMASGNEADVFANLERLADLARKGVLTDSEYQAKKAELLARL
jgi:hypothetical protein